MLSEPEPTFSANHKDSRLRRTRLAGVLTIAAAAVALGLLAVATLGPLNSAPARATSVTAAPAVSAPTSPAASVSTPTPSASASTPAAAGPPSSPAATVPPAAADWSFFTDATGQATFEHPVGWTVTEAPQTTEVGAFNTVKVKNPAGKTMASLHLVYDGAGGPVCPEPKPFRTLDSITLDIPQKASKLKEFPRGPSAFMFRVIEADRVYGSMALSDIALDPGSVTCGLYNGILAPDNVPFAHFGDSIWLEASGEKAALTFASVAEAKAYMQTKEYQDVKRMLTSLELRPVK